MVKFSQQKMINFKINKNKFMTFVSRPNRPGRGHMPTESSRSTLVNILYVTTKSDMINDLSRGGTAGNKLLNPHIPA